MAKTPSRIENCNRLAQRLRDAEAEVLRLASAIDVAQADWQKALADGDDAAERAALKTVDAARMAHATALSRLPVLKDALQDARVAALPERLEACEPELARVNDAAVDAAGRALEAVQALEQALADVMRLSGAHRNLIGGLRDHANEAGRQLVTDRGTAYPVNIRVAGHLQATLRPMKISKSLVYAQPKELPA